MHEAAVRLATDVGYNNQMGCANAQLAFIECGDDPTSRARLRQFGDLVFESIQRLPATISTAAPRLDADFKAKLDAALDARRRI